MGKRGQRRVWRVPTPEDAQLRFHADRGSRLWGLRDEAHRAFDVHWSFYETSEERSRARKWAYSWLSQRLGIPEAHCHFGMFGEDQCLRAIEVCRTSAPHQSTRRTS